MTDIASHRSADPAHAIEAAMRLAHDCLSSVLQHDYLSNGVGHKQSTALVHRRAGRLTRVARATGIEPVHHGDDDRLAPAGDALHDDAAADEHALPASTSADAARDGLMQRYLVEIGRRRRLTSSQEYRLARAARDGNAGARQQLIESHLGFVVMIARRYRDHPLPLLDRIEEGNIGLLTAIEKFDPELGHRLSTYAKWWVRQSIELALMTQSRVVHVPVHVSRALKRSAKARRSAGPDASDAAATKPFEAHDREATADAERDRALLRDAQKFLLFDVGSGNDAPAGADGDDARSVLDSLAAPEHEQPDWHVHLSGRARRLHAALMRLSETERIVVRSRYGLDDDEIRTLESVAAQLRISAERVRQIQAEVLPKLRRILLEQGLGRDSML